MAYNVSGLTNYVEVNKDALIKSVVLGSVYGDTIQNLRKQLGVKTKERLNYLDVNPVFQNGQGCGFSAQGSTVLSEREIETAIFKINDEYCPDTLLNKYAEFMVKFGANRNAEDMPFESEILSEIEKKINLEMEKQVWQGDKSATGRTDLIDGYLTQALGADSASTIAVSYTAATASTYDAIKAVVMAIPEEIIDNATIFVAPAVYRAFVQEMVEKNYIHYSPDGHVEDKDITFPGTDVKVHKTIGLTGDKKHIYASVYDNMVYAADLMNDKEEARLWFSDDDDLFKLKIKWNAGVATLYPDEVVVLTSTNDLA